jgi:hypothetical protein
VDKILRYHPVIPFKKSDDIIRHIAKAIEGTDNYFSPGVKTTSGSFSIYKNCGEGSNNCENFVNVCVLGVNFSELAARRQSEDIIGNLICLGQQLFETSIQLDNLAHESSIVNRVREINGYKNSVYYHQGIKMEARIEVQPKE